MVTLAMKIEAWKKVYQGLVVLFFALCASVGGMHRKSILSLKNSEDNKQRHMQL